VAAGDLLDLALLGTSLPIPPPGEQRHRLKTALLSVQIAARYAERNDTCEDLQESSDDFHGRFSWIDLARPRKALDHQHPGAAAATEFMKVPV
jgi:hypothetical protein